MNNTEVLNVIEKPVGSMKILLHLHQHKKTTITNLLRSEHLNQKSTYTALGKLQNEGLIVLEESDGFPQCKYYLLTDKGRVVARQLNRVASTLVRDALSKD